ncbi:MAG: FmdB family zinc ribbon protein [Planctomycetota bacterium]
MPTYEYECSACEHAFEKFQSMSARPVKKCPECGKNKVQRLIGAGSGIIFKGSGFYETDYKRSGSSSSSTESSSSKSESSSSSSSD